MKHRQAVKKWLGGWWRKLFILCNSLFSIETHELMSEEENIILWLGIGKTLSVRKMNMCIIMSLSSLFYLCLLFLSVSSSLVYLNHCYACPNAMCYAILH